MAGYIVQPNDTFKAEFVCSFQNQTALPGMHYYALTVAGTGVHDTDLATYLDANGGPWLKQLITNTAHYVETRVQKIWPLPVQAAQYANAQAAAGTAGSSPLPGQEAPIISFTTAKAGRAFRGRMYMPFMDDSDLDATDPQEVSTAYAGIAASFAAAIAPSSNITVTVGGSNVVFIPCVYHRTAGKTGVPAAHTVDGITGGRVRLLIGTQRRRGPLGRPNAAP